MMGVGLVVKLDLRGLFDAVFPVFLGCFVASDFILFSFVFFVFAGATGVFILSVVLNDTFVFLSEYVLMVGFCIRCFG